MRVIIQAIRPRTTLTRSLSTSTPLHLSPTPSTSFAPSSSSQADESLLTPLKKYPKFLRRTRQDEEELLWDLEDVEEEDERHMSSFGWEIWAQKKQFFEIMRTLERDKPVLEQYRLPFTPPDPTKTPVLVRSITYAGEPFHPATPKRTITVPVSLLPLTNSNAIHNIKVLSGTRWTIEPPKDSGLPQERHEPVFSGGGENTKEKLGEHGFIKISCEQFPEGQMNLKWCMDTLRRLVKESNDRALQNGFTDVPLPTRHIDSRIRAKGRGGSSYKTERRRVTLKDFPTEWLPKAN